MVRQPKARSVDWLWWATSSGELQPFLDHPDRDQREIAREKSAVALQLARLGDPVDDCLRVLAPDVLADAIWRLPNPTRTDTLRTLRVPPARRPTPAIAQHALNRLRRQTPNVRAHTAQVVTLPVLRVLLPTTMDTDVGVVDGEILESLKTAGFTPELVRLTALADWGFNCEAAALLRLALTDANLALAHWPTDVIEDIVVAARRFEDFCRERLGGADDDRSPPLRPLDEVLGRACVAVDAVGAAVRGGRAPDGADLAVLAEIEAAVEQAREAVAVIVGAAAHTLPEDRGGLADAITAYEAAVHAREVAEVERFLGLGGPPAHDAVIRQLRESAGELAGRHESWDTADRGRALALGDLAALIDAIAADRDDDAVDEMAERVRPHVPDPTIVNAALRGRLVWTATPRTEGTHDAAADVAIPEPRTETAADADALPGTEADDADPSDGAEDADAPAASARDAEGPADVGSAEPAQDADTAPFAADAGTREAADDATPAGASEPETGATTEAGEEEGRPATAAPAPAPHDMLGALIGRGEYAAAHALLADEPERGAAIRALAYADGARSDTGALALSLRDELDAMSLREPSHDRATQLLTVAAAARAAVLCGHSTYGLLQDAAAGLADLPAIADLARHIAAGSAQGLLGGPRVLSALAALAEAEAGAAAAASAANEALSHPRHLRFPRATAIAAQWWRPEDGLLGRLLRRAADNDRNHLDEVAETLRRLTKHHELDARLATADEELRNGKGHRLEGPARRRLLEYARESLDTVSRWVDATRRVVETEAAAEPWIAGPLTDLRHALIADRPDAETELDRAAEQNQDPLIAGAARAAAASLAATLDLLDGHPLTGPEPAPETILATGTPARDSA